MKCSCKEKSTRFFLQNKNRILQICDICSLVYVQASPKPETKSITETSDEFIKEYLQEEKSYRDYFVQKLQMLHQYKKTGSLLDIGCGIGVFLDCARKHNWNVQGVDFCTYAVKFARNLGLKITLGIFEKTSFNKQFDVITSFQTIEHTTNPLYFLTKARRLLKSSGLLIITTPDEQGFCPRIMKKRWFGYYNEEHMYFFNKKSLEKLLSAAGFKNITITTENSRVLSFSWVMTRLFCYYYNQQNIFVKLLIKTRPLWPYFNFIKLREPQVNLVAIATT